MKYYGIILAATCLFASTPSLAKSESSTINVFSASSYLNFYLMNLNACEEFHPSVQMSANKAEQVLYPHLQKLSAIVESGKLSQKEQQQLRDLLLQRKAMINEQIKSGELTLDHCNTVINIVTNEGLDPELLKSL